MWSSLLLMISSIVSMGLPKILILIVIIWIHSHRKCWDVSATLGSVRSLVFWSWRCLLPSGSMLVGYDLIEAMLAIWCCWGKMLVGFFLCHWVVLFEVEIEEVILNVVVDNAFREWKEGFRSYGNAAGSLPCKFVSQFITVYSFMSWDPPQFNSVRGTLCVKLVSDLQH